jgi:16S rRNA (guanine966-N2)-methyltransferase
MRITGGEWGGRRIEVPARGVRPTQDRVRQALFNVVAARMPGCRFLDLFAGSGAVGLEALSRGAGQVTWVERDAGALRVLRANVAALCSGVAASAAEVVDGDAPGYLRSGGGGRRDIIFADPPYDRGATVSWPALLFGAVGRPERCLTPGGLLILEDSEDQPWVMAEESGWTLRADKRYGGTRLRFWGSRG